MPHDRGNTHQPETGGRGTSQLCFFPGEPQSEVQVYRSRDNARTWTGRQAAIVATNFSASTGGPDTSIFHDRPTVTVENNPTSFHYGRLYVTWTTFHMLPTG